MLSANSREMKMSSLTSSITMALPVVTTHTAIPAFAGKRRPTRNSSPRPDTA